jgi:hypothetical protein
VAAQPFRMNKLSLVVDNPLLTRALGTTSRILIYRDLSGISRADAFKALEILTFPAVSGRPRK